jgi:hypothetical protein
MRSFIAVTAVLVGCANDPQYVAAPSKLVATAVAAGGVTNPVGTMSLPIKSESVADAAKRMALANQLGVMVPYVKLGDIAVEIEWTIHNDDTMPGQAKVEFNGGNEFFYYDPNLVNLAPPNAENPPPTPGLQGDIPIDVPAGGDAGGLFREDQWLEASIDLDEITRGNITPFYEGLTVNKNDQSFQPMSAPMPANMTYTAAPVGNVIPRPAFAAMVCFELKFKPDRPMTFTYTVRVRDIRGTLIDPMGLDPSFNPRAGDHVFVPAAYTVGAATGTATQPCLPL